MDQLLLDKRTSFGCEENENIHERRPIEIIGKDWSSEMIALFFRRLLGRVSLSCRVTMDLLCQEMKDACRHSSASSDFLPDRGRGVTLKERETGKEIKTAPFELC